MYIVVQKWFLALVVCLVWVGCDSPPSSMASSVVDTKSTAPTAKSSNGFQNGDLIFQTSTSSQSKAIQLATASRYSHVGLLYQQSDGSWCVYEAVATIRCTDLEAWIARGKNQHYVVKRLRDAARLLTPARLRAMREAGEAHLGTPYDITFQWDNERFYCSELVWKLYRDAIGIELAPLTTIESMALNNPVVQQKLTERYGDAIPMNETVVAPGALFDSKHLVTVSQH